jgi:ketosteroid isomerase-like protein
MTSSPSEQSKARVIEAWQVFKTRDPERIAAVFTEDAEWLAPPGNATAVALGGSHHIVGRAPITQFLATEMYRLFRDIQIEFRGVHADGDTVIVEERMQATLPNGTHYDNDYCFLFELADGRIRRVREYMDTQRGKQMILGSP